MLASWGPPGTPLGALLGSLGGLLGRLLAVMGLSWAVLGPSGLSWGALRSLLGPPGAFWERLGALWGRLGPPKTLRTQRPPARLALDRINFTMYIGTHCISAAICVYSCVYIYIYIYPIVVVAHASCAHSMQLPSRRGAACAARAAHRSPIRGRARPPPSFWLERSALRRSTKRKGADLNDLRRERMPRSRRLSRY